MKKLILAALILMTGVNASASEAYWASLADKCSTLPNHISFEEARKTIYDLRSKKPNEYDILLDKEYPGGKVFTFIAPEGKGTITSTIGICKYILMSEIADSNAGEKPEPLNNEVWLVTDKRGCVRDKEIDSFDRLYRDVKTNYSNKIAFESEDKTGRQIAFVVDGNVLYFVDNEALCQSVINDYKNRTNLTRKDIPGP